MPVLATDLQNQVLRELKLSTTDPAALANVEAIWNLYPDKDLVPNAPRLRMFYTLERYAAILVGEVAPDTDYVNGPEEQRDGQQFDHWQKVMLAARAAIKDIEDKARLQQPVIAGAITSVQASQHQPGRLSPYDSFFRGDPLRRRRGGW